MPVGVEDISDLAFQDPALRARWPDTPSSPYLRPSKDEVYPSQLSGLGAPLSRNFPYKFHPGLAL